MAKGDPRKPTRHQERRYPSILEAWHVPRQGPTEPNGAAVKRISAATDRLRIDRAARLLTDRIDTLEKRVREGDETAWPVYQETLRTLTALLPHLGPDRGTMLTTAEMADRLGVAPKTLLRHKAKGRIKPAVAQGKLLRWKGNEALDGKGDGNSMRK